MTDYQRTSVYRAEQRLDLPGEIFRDTTEAQLYADAVCEQEGVPAVSVIQGRGDRSSLYNSARREIRLGRGHLKEWVLIHEISHYLEDVRRGNARGDHGPTFCGTYLRLIEACMGDDAARRLNESFMMYGVHVIRTERIAPEAAMAALVSPPLTFAELRVGDDVVIDGSHLNARSAHWAGKAGTVVKKNRTKVVVRMETFGQRLTIEPGLLRRS
jgi:putative metallohydrolase (TIGR04338 family)